MKSFVVWGGGGCLYEVGKRDSLCNIWACPEPAELPGHDREPTCPKCLEKIKVQGGSVVRPGHDPMIYLISSDFDPLRKLTALNRLRKRVEGRGEVLRANRMGWSTPVLLLPDGTVTGKAYAKRWWEEE